MSEQSDLFGAPAWREADDAPWSEPAAAAPPPRPAPMPEDTEEDGFDERLLEPAPEPQEPEPAAEPPDPEPKPAAAQPSELDLYGLDLFGQPVRPKASGKIAERFTVPPFSVLNAREGAWQDRKRQWLTYGIRGEVGRDAKAYNDHAWMEEKLAGGSRAAGGGVSIFDPVLCELAYRWFCPPGGQVVDPFAGGSVRGIVAALLGRRYWGCDLSAQQVAANVEQGATICAEADAVTDPAALTPVTCADGVFLKRDDQFRVGNVGGGKARTCLALARAAVARGVGGLVTAGARTSPQANIVAEVGRLLGLRVNAHTPQGELGGELRAAQAAGATVTQHQAGYNNVICARAREDAQALGWAEIPFGMECEEAVTQTRRQVANIPQEVARVVVPVGSGMTLAGILWGLRDAGRSLPVVGVRVGADPTRRLDQYAPDGWRETVTLIESSTPYDRPAPGVVVGGVLLDSHYEAKVREYMRAGDLLWIVGDRPTERQAGTPTPVWVCGDSAETLSAAPEADFIFSCPPYGDLERYSDDPADISAMDYPAFCAAYERIIALACERLKPNRFACFVVGDLRDKRGFYRGFVSETERAFRQAGLELYNEMILVTSVGSLPIRITKQFEAGRKAGKTHQNVLVFCKGDWRKAAAAIKEVKA